MQRTLKNRRRMNFVVMKRIYYEKTKSKYLLNSPKKEVGIL